MTYFWLMLAEGLLMAGLVILAIREVAWVVAQRRRAVSDATPSILHSKTLLGEINTRFVRTRPGRWLARD